MNCKDIEKLIAAFLDGEATAKEQGLIKEHIANCQSCSEDKETLSATQDNVRLAFESRVAKYAQSEDEWQRLRQQITTMEPREATRQGVFGS